jgi:transposase
VPLVIRTAPANASDRTQIQPAVAEFPEISGALGRPRTKPDVVYGDRGYDSQATRAALREQHITRRIAQRGKEHGSGLGKIRWVVERTIHWFKGFRRIRIRYDRTRVVQNAWNALAASAICFRIAARTGVCAA